VLQTDPRPGAVAANVNALVRGLVAQPADLTLTPELSATGYDLGDAVHDLAVPCSPGSALPLPGGEPLVDLSGLLVIGLVERDRDGVPYNTAAVLDRGMVRFVHRKVYLPTYGMFDEARFFGRGRSIRGFEAGAGWRAGVLVCEDFWHPGLVYVLAAAGIDVLLVQAAAPARGVGGDRGIGSAVVWERMARATAEVYGIYVAIANRVGVEGGVTFAGGSLVVGPDGAVRARAGADGPARLDVELREADLFAARRPFAHIRDDEPGLVREALANLARGT
jgi:predicted amidohydrolase